MKRALRNLSYITTATLAKVALGVVISIIVLARIPHHESAEAFQLLLLQSAMITLISASAFPRGVSVDGNMRHGAGLVLALLLAAALVGVVIFAAAHMLAGTRYWPASAADTELALLWIGAIATGLHTLLQGVFLKSNGARATFLPLTVAQLGATAVIVVIDAGSAAALIRIIVAAQCLPLVLFSIVNFRSLTRLDWRDAGGEVGFIMGYLRESISFGATATAYLIVFLVLREAWRGTVDSSVAAYVFFAMRLSEVYMQIAYYVFSSARTGDGIGAMASSDGVMRIRKRLPMLIAGAAMLAVLVVTGLFTIDTSIWLPILAIAAQATVDLVRLPVTVYLVQAIQRGRPALYGFIVLPPLMLVILTFAMVRSNLPQATLYYCQIAFAAGVALFWRLGAARFPATITAARPPAAQDP